MQRGRKALPSEVKKQRGTYQPCRAKDEITVPEDQRLPVMPDYLTDEAQAVWFEEVDRVIAAQVTALDSTLFARYCAVEAQVRALLSKGEVPKGNLLTELRRMAECLGLAGPSSRIGKGAPAPVASPFASLLPQ